MLLLMGGRNMRIVLRRKQSPRLLPSFLYHELSKAIRRNLRVPSCRKKSLDY